MTSLLDATTVSDGTMLALYLALALVLFTIGGIGVVLRRNPVVVFMCIELMLNAVNLTFLAFARYQPSHWAFVSKATDGGMGAAMSGQMMVIFVMAVAAAEVAVGLGIIMAIFRMRNEVDVDDMRTLKD
jgi:NADH-quinone oxidoreductase subunit K